MRIDDFEIRKSGKDKCIVTRYCGTADEVEVPARIGDFTPVEIGPAFLRKSAKVRRIILPPTIESMDTGLFCQLRHLEDIEVESRRLVSKDGVLYDRQMKTLLLYPAAKPGKDFFCPETVSRVGEDAFAAGCTIEVFHAPDSISSFPVLPSQCPRLEAFTGKAARDGVLYSGRKLLFYPPKRPGSAFSVPEGIESIEVGSEPLFPPSVKSIHVPQSLKAGLLENAVHAAEVDIDAGSKLYVSLSGVVFSRSSKALLMYPQGRECDVYFVPSGTLSIASHAFRGASLSALILPNGISSIEAEAFADASIGIITLPSTLSSIDIMAFQGLKDVREIRVERLSIPDVFMQASSLRPLIRYAEHL